MFDTDWLTGEYDSILTCLVQLSEFWCIYLKKKICNKNDYDCSSETNGWFLHLLFIYYLWTRHRNHTDCFLYAFTTLVLYLKLLLFIYFFTNPVLLYSCYVVKHFDRKALYKYNFLVYYYYYYYLFIKKMHDVFQLNFELNKCNCYGVFSQVRAFFWMNKHHIKTY